MKPVFEREQLERLRTLIASRLGLDYAEDKFDDLASAASKRIEAEGLASVEEYLERLVRLAGAAPGLFALAEELTVTETFFFRSADHLRVLSEVVVPAIRRSGRRRIQVASIGCASGEEPYSIAMQLCETIPDIERWDVSINAFDVNPAMLKKARAATYSPWALRVTSEALRARYFAGSGREQILDAKIRDMVRFEQLNLADDAAQAWRGLACDAIFCRNVLMYLTPEVVQRVISRIERALTEGGFLFLGHAETLRGLSHDFHLCHTHEAFYYQRRRDGEERAGEYLPRFDADHVQAAFVAAPDAVSWVDSIHQASARVAKLAEPSAAAERRGVGPVTDVLVSAARPSWDLGAVLELLRLERFAEALATLRALPEETRRDQDAMLLLSVLLTNRGARDEAEQACRALLALDELNAGAHYLMALCREHAADLGGAREHDRTAIYLDPSFAMPHLHLGLLARRSGERTIARRELGQALILLKREDASRLMLFGGGFSREALLRLCRVELESAGGEA